MEAYAALVPLFNDLELIPNHPTHSFSFDDKQIASLSKTVDFLIDFVDSFDSHVCAREAAEALESRIASAARAAHGVIESHIVHQIHAGSTRGSKVRSYFLLDLQKAIDNMEFVKRKAMQFKAKGGIKTEQPTYSSAAAATSSEPLKNGNSNGMVGFDEVVLQLVDVLTGEPSKQRAVVPIAGMGGLGKTSLAKTVYEHSYVTYHFDVRLWATISQQYSAENILTQLLNGERKSTTCGNASELREQLHKRLYGRRYLIVLDDMWDVKAWDEVQMYLPDNGNGSRVVVTTRDSALAAHLCSSPFKLNFLDEDKSWELFCKKAFGEEEDCPVELEGIGKKIVEKCMGLPLSIVVIAGHLRKSSRAIEYWEKFANYMNPISSIGEEERCLEILGLSYQHLPASLKPCFLYLGTFKEDESIWALDVVRRWIGEGFLKPKKELSLEEAGEDCFRDLIDRNLILVVGRSWNGKVESCKIHDSVRELCLKVCEKEKFHMIGVKRLSAPPLLHLVDRSSHRVLLRDIRIYTDRTSLASAYSQQLNSRLLEFVQYRLQSLYSIYSSISACWNLQTLRIKNSSYAEPIITLPYEIWEMPQLRYLVIYGVAFLMDPAPGEESDQDECIVLQNLHTLEGVVNLRLTGEVCKRMPNLKTLSLMYDHFYDDYCFHNVDRFNKLKSLSIAFKEDSNSKWCDAILSLTFPTSLEELYLSTSRHLHWEDLTMMISSQLPHLGSLEVTSVCGSEWNLDEEVFYCLKALEIEDCGDLINWNANSSHFPVLETLTLIGMSKLGEIPLNIGEIPTLTLIRLVDCGVSAAVSAVRMVVEQETNGNLDLQLHVEFWDDEGERFQEMLLGECLKSNSLHLFYYGIKITIALCDAEKQL